MEAPTAPTEWVGGDSEAAFFLGNVVVLWLAAAAGYFVGNTAFPVGPGAPVYAIWPEVAVMVAFAIPIDLLYLQAVSCPRSIGISPTGLVVVFGIHKRSYRWDDVLLRKGEALCFRRNGRWPARVALNPNQRQRLSAFLGAVREPVRLRALPGAG